MEYILLLTLIPIIVTILTASIYHLIHSVFDCGGDVIVAIKAVIICHTYILLILFLENYCLSLISKLINQ